MGRLWWVGPGLGRHARPGPSNFHVMSRGPARPIRFSCGGPRPGPAYQFFRGWAVARPSPSIFQRMGRGPAQPIAFSNFHDPVRPGPLAFQICQPGLARPMTLAARPKRHGLYTGWPVISVGRPVNLTGRATGRPMCCPVLKAKSYVLTYFFRCTCTINSCNSTVNTLFFLLDSVGYSPRATRTNNPHNFAT